MFKNDQELASWNNLKYKATELTSNGQLDSAVYEQIAIVDSIVQSNLSAISQEEFYMLVGSIETTVLLAAKEIPEDRVAPKPKWKLSYKHSDEGRSVEISALIEGIHGDESWGWFGDDKIQVLSTMSTYQRVPVDKRIIVQALAVAQEIVDSKNNEE